MLHGKGTAWPDLLGDLGDDPFAKQGGGGLWAWGNPSAHPGILGVP